MILESVMLLFSISAAKGPYSIAFDAVDSSCGAERQRLIFDKVVEIIDMDFAFNDKVMWTYVFYTFDSNLSEKRNFEIHI